jgi:excisionase family DNA binding protein
MRAACDTADPETTPAGARYLKVPQVATRLNVSVRTVYELLASRELGSVKIRGALRVPCECLADYEAGLRR